MQWQEKITRVVRRVAKDLIANDETEISEVVRRRLFDDIGSDRIRKSVSKSYADWCFERRAQLPPEWTAVDSATTEAKSRGICADALRSAIRSIRRLFRCSKGSGRRFRSISRPAQTTLEIFVAFWARFSSHQLVGPTPWIHKCNRFRARLTSDL